MSNIQTSQGKIFNNVYLVKKKISSGSFGVVYLGHDVKTKDYVAIKVEKQGSDEMMSIEREVHQISINKKNLQVQILKHLNNIPQIPKLYWSGTEGNSNVMVIQLLGRDLTHYLKIYRRFSLKCALNIIDQMLTILENIHKRYQFVSSLPPTRGILHRDIKPENILVGRDSENQLIYLVDYGISKIYRDSKGQHIPHKENKPFLGTSRYASIAAHKGQEISRKDDLESLAYMIVFLLKGTLPWQNIQHSNDQDKIKQVGQMKMSMDANELCKDLPPEFARFLDFVKKLSFKSQPDYKYFQQLFRRLAATHNFQQQEKTFDWFDAVQQSENLKKKNRRQSAERSSMNQLHSSSGFKRQSMEQQQFKSQHNNDELVQSSFLRLPDQRNSNGTSILSVVERHSNRHKSVSSFNDSYSEITPDGSILVGFQPSILSHRFVFTYISIQKTSKYTSSVVAMSPQMSSRFLNIQNQMQVHSHSPLHQRQSQFSQRRSGKDLPLVQYSSKELLNGVSKDNLQSNLLIFALSKEQNNIQEPTLQQLNEDDNQDLEVKMQFLQNKSISSHFKNPIIMNQIEYEKKISLRQQSTAK